MPTTVETIREGFPYPSIDKHPGCHTYTIISEVHKKLKTNSASVHSNLGGGQHGLLRLNATRQDIYHFHWSSVHPTYQSWYCSHYSGQSAAAALKSLNLNARTKKRSVNGKRLQDPIRRYNNYYSPFSMSTRVTLE